MRLVDEVAYTRGLRRTIDALTGEPSKAASTRSFFTPLAEGFRFLRGLALEQMRLEPGQGLEGMGLGGEVGEASE